MNNLKLSIITSYMILCSTAYGMEQSTQQARAQENAGDKTRRELGYNRWQVEEGINKGVVIYENEEDSNIHLDAWKYKELIQQKLNDKTE